MKLHLYILSAMWILIAIVQGVHLIRTILAFFAL